MSKMIKILFFCYYKGGISVGAYSYFACGCTPSLDITSQNTSILVHLK